MGDRVFFFFFCWHPLKEIEQYPEGSLDFDVMRLQTLRCFSSRFHASQLFPPPTSLFTPLSLRFVLPQLSASSNLNYTHFYNLHINHLHPNILFIALFFIHHGNTLFRRAVR